MRRNEFASEDPKLLEELLLTCEFGTLALFETAPYAIPINFAPLKNEIIFHGATAGRKFTIISQNPCASFSVVHALSLLPSYFSDTPLACAASAMFISAHITGQVRILETAQEKQDALNALMQKLQPEGGYAPLEADDSRYESALKRTAVFALKISEYSLKLKLGQNQSKERQEALIKRLQERGSALDLLSVQYMRRFLK